jgi:hypothetical protein
VLAGAMCIALTACTSPPPATSTPEPSYTTVPTTSPTPQPGVDIPLASTVERAIGYPIQMKVYDVGVWNAQQGCGCSAPGESGELYPAGSVVWAIRVDLISVPNWANDDGIDAAALTLDSSWGPGAPVPVEAEEGEAVAAEEGLGWGFPSAQTPAVFPWGQTRSFLMAVYVPRGAVALRLDLMVPPSSSNSDAEPIPVGLDVEVPQSVIDVMYAGNYND